MKDICFASRQVVEMRGMLKVPQVPAAGEAMQGIVHCNYNKLARNTDGVFVLLCTVPGCNRPRRNARSHDCELHLGYKCSYCHQKPLPGYALCIKHILRRNCDVCFGLEVEAPSYAVYGSNVCAVHYIMDTFANTGRCYNVHCTRTVTPGSVASKAAICDQCFMEFCGFTPGDYEYLCKNVDSIN